MTGKKDTKPGPLDGFFKMVRIITETNYLQLPEAEKQKVRELVKK